MRVVRVSAELLRDFLARGSLVIRNGHAHEVIVGLEGDPHLVEARVAHNRGGELELLFAEGEPDGAGDDAEGEAIVEQQVVYHRHGANA